MTKLYSKLAKIYHEIYQQIFHYKKEFQFYNRVLKKYKCNSVLEIGCGTGNLATSFIKSGYEYLGLDLNEEMLKIAKDEVAPDAKFVQGDMRKLKIRKRFDAVIISGRSFTYMLTNEDVISTFESIYKVLSKEGVLIFDNFNAATFDFNWKNKEKFTCGNKVITRKSSSSPNFKTGFSKNWYAEYHIKEKGKEAKVIKDETLMRAFLIEEINLLLQLSKFKLLKTIKQEFTFITIARKNART